MLWFDLRLNSQTIGSMEIQRHEDLDLGDPASADTVCTYTVYVDGLNVGEVRHRYGDGAWRLVALAADLASL